MVCIFCYIFRQYGYLSYLNRYNFRAKWYLPIEINQSILKTGPAPASLDSENYSNTFYLANLSKEIIVS